MKLKWLLLGIAIVLLAWLLPQKGETLATLPQHGRILAFGDSLTQGVGASAGADYPSVLANLTGLEVVNAGISGETSGEGAQRFAQVLDATQPHLVLLLQGGNDFLRNMSEHQVELNLAQMIEQAQQRDIAIVLIAVPQKGIWLTPASLYKRLSEQYGLLLIEDKLAELLKSSELKSDAIHLNNAGYRQLAVHLHQRLQQAGAI